MCQAFWTTLWCILKWIGCISLFSQHGKHLGEMGQKNFFTVRLRSPSPTRIGQVCLTQVREDYSSPKTNGEMNKAIFHLGLNCPQLLRLFSFPLFFLLLSVPSPQDMSRGSLWWKGNSSVSHLRRRRTFFSLFLTGYPISFFPTAAKDNFPLKSCSSGGKICSYNFHGVAFSSRILFLF